LRAVVFDLWGTLVDWPFHEWNAYKREFAARLGMAPDRFDVLWQETYPLRETGRLAEALRIFGADDGLAAEFTERRRDVIRKALVPSPATLDTLDELRKRGLGLGLISVCSEEVPHAWPETPFAGRFDAAVFSAVCGLMKPDPRIYLLATGELGVEPHEALFVGDGANDELAGAERVGMRPVLIHRPDEEPFWDEVKQWDGLRVTAVGEVLDLL
jgi:putative hydrolase of the HAD superfamily